jgi:protein gp37
MGDLFHEDVPDRSIAAVFGVMAACPKHTFQILTKRPERIREWFQWANRMQPVGFDGLRLHPLAVCFGSAVKSICIKVPESINNESVDKWPWPLPNVWLGVSASTQEELGQVVPPLLETPAAKRFVSLEPLLGKSNIAFYSSKIDWVICGAETGPGKRHMELDWARSIRDQCISAGVPFFFKKDSNGSNQLDGRTWEEMPL